MPVISPELERWRGAAMAPTEVKRSFSVPFDVMLGEAIDVVRYFETHWKTVRDDRGEIVRRGLDLVKTKPNTLVKETLGDDLVSLVHAAGHQNTIYRLEVEALPDSPLKRGLYVLGEIRSTVEYYFTDDGIDDIEDERLVALAEAHPSDQYFTMDRLAVASPTTPASPRSIARCSTASAASRSPRSTRRRSSPTRSARVPRSPRRRPRRPKQALDLRNRLLTLIDQRVAAVRKAARHVYRDQPELARAVTSAYERRRRAASRRAKAEAAKTEPAAE